MDEYKSLAIDLAKACIQNNNVKPIYNKNYSDDASIIIYVLGDSTYSFTDIVSHFQESLRKIDEHY